MRDILASFLLLLHFLIVGLMGKWLCLIILSDDDEPAFE